MSLPASVLRRADAVTVIGAALLAKAGGAGHRRVAVELGRPVSTVRGWVRRIASPTSTRQGHHNLHGHN